jgi:DNA-binding CsgD family transcriptional regulator/tetratricopeptide (TPR) repeat protein
MGEGIAPRTQLRRRRIIERPRLTRLLDTGQGRIKMLVAPAGYGKTTLVRQWLVGKTATWYTATQASTDVAALAAGLRGAVAVLVPGSGEALMERLPVTLLPEEEPEVLAGMLAGDLAAWPADAWLVFDDYQAIAGTSPAERFVEGLLLGAPLNLILMTRHRPAWASSRRILYGEVFELDRGSLAMTDAEARDLLSGSGRDAAELVELAQGWPAVLGLAALSSSPPPELTATPHLYGFFAEEIYQRIDPAVRRALCELALYGAAGRRVALQLLRPDEAERVILAGVNSGFLTEAADGLLDMHPLLRTFLERKLAEGDPKTMRKIVGRAAGSLIRNELWDEAFELIQRFSATERLPELIEAAMEGLLASGRTSTLRAWADAGAEDAPVVRLAGAELAFREGRYYEAETLARLAASDVMDESAARAYVVAGRAAHAASREEEASALYQRALASTADPVLKRVAAYGELAAAIELERGDAPELLEALARSDSLGPDDRVVLAGRRLYLETHFGMPVSLEDAAAARQLLGHVRDPMRRASFRNIYGHTLAASGYFDEASAVIEEQLEDADHSRLEFVVPYCYTARAIVHTGRREYVLAEETLDEAEQRALRSGDQTAFHIAWAVRNRLYISQGAFELALTRELSPHAAVTKCLHAELLASQALALAGTSRPDRVRVMAVEAEKESIGIETAITAGCALAVLALRQGFAEEGLQRARTALSRATESRMIEAFVVAYRGFPELVVSLLQDRDAHDDLSRVLLRVGDDSIVTSSERSDAERSVQSLSRREKEVLALLAQGMSNAEIGHVLFISPVTVKVHVRHIFEKLGVRTRAAAVLRATQLGR